MVARFTNGGYTVMAARAVIGDPGMVKTRTFKGTGCMTVFTNIG